MRQCCLLSLPKGALGESTRGQWGTATEFAEKVFSSPERGRKCQQGSSPPQPHAIVLSPLNLFQRVPQAHCPRCSPPQSQTLPGCVALLTILPPATPVPMTTSFSEHGQQVSQPHWLTGLLFRADTAHVHRICTHYVLLFNKMITSMIRPRGNWGHSLYASHHVPGVCSEANM